MFQIVDQSFRCWKEEKKGACSWKTNLSVLRYFLALVSFGHLLEQCTCVVSHPRVIRLRDLGPAGNTDEAPAGEQFTCIHGLHSPQVEALRCRRPCTWTKYSFFFCLWRPCYKDYTVTMMRHNVGRQQVHYNKKFNNIIFLEIKSFFYDLFGLTQLFVIWKNRRDNDFE
jgi:hypothetical protein